MSALELGNVLVKLCSAGQFTDVIDQHYADDIVSVEARDQPGFPREMAGLTAVKAKNTWWAENHEVHGVKVEGPFPHGDDRFAVVMEVDVTPKTGPESGQRSSMREVCLYTVRDGKISREEFFYGLA